jgi:DNA-binding transcriptional regulator YhcF (GntR family)
MAVVKSLGVPARRLVNLSSIRLSRDPCRNFDNGSRPRIAKPQAYVHYFTNALGGWRRLLILKPHSGVPIYRQLLEQIRRMAASGQLPPGTELPSIRDLALKHAINPMTVSKVYTLLEAEGVLERNRGKPMTVAAPKRAQSPVAKRLEQLEPHVEQVALAARQLELTEKDVVKALHDSWERTDVESLHRRARSR